jgi:hypothetical protein
MRQGPILTPKPTCVDPNQTRPARSRFNDNNRSAALLRSVAGKGDRNVFLSGGLHLSKFPAGRPHDLLLHRVVLAAHYRCFRSIPTSRHLRLGQGNWVIGWIVFPFIFMLAYLIFQGRGMAERSMQQARQARDELKSAVGFSVADEIEKLNRLKQAGSISDAEFARLRARLVQ